MSPREGIFYAGWMAGIIVCVLTGRMLGINNIICLVAGVILGAGLGYVAQQAFLAVTAKSQPPGFQQPDSAASKRLGPDEVACRNLKCDWVGNKRHYSNCPKCNERLPN